MGRALRVARALKAPRTQVTLGRRDGVLDHRLEMDLPVAPMTSAEILQVRDGQIVNGELIYDAQELRDCDGGE